MTQYYLFPNEEGYCAPIAKRALPFRLFKIENDLMYELICVMLPGKDRFLWWPQFFETPPTEGEVSVDELVDKFKDDSDVLRPILEDV